jgi:hypothetical protein
MRRIILAFALVGILAVPAKARDGTQTPSAPNVSFNGTPSPAYVMPPLKAEPLPPGLLAQAPNPAKAQSFKDQLVGVWALTSCNVGLLPSWCAKPGGLMILDASGYYTILHVGCDRPKVAANPLRDASAEEYKRIAMEVQANFGTWSVDEAGKTLTWHIQGGLFPNVEGNNFIGGISLSGDELKLIAVGEPPRPIPTPQVWQRIGK